MTLIVSLTAPIFRKLTIIPPERRFANNGCSLQLKATANLGEAVLKTCNLSYHLRGYWQVCKFLLTLIIWQIQTNSNYLRLILKYYKIKKRYKECINYKYFLHIIHLLFPINSIFKEYIFHNNMLQMATISYDISPSLIINI